MKSHPQIQNHVYRAHGDWLVQRDEFLAAEEQYLKAGNVSTAKRLLMDLVDAKLSMSMFSDACRIYLRLARLCTAPAEFVSFEFVSVTCGS